MAFTLQLTHATPAGVGTIVYLWSTTPTTGWHLRDWKPKVGSFTDPRPLTEVLDFEVRNTSDNALATSFQGVDEARRLADLYVRDPVHETPVWLTAKMTGETGARRSLVRRIEMEWLSNPMSPVGHAGGSDARVRLKITREPWWEDYLTTTLPAGYISSLNFDSGSTIVVPAETITGATSGHSAIVVGVTTRSGTYAGGNAAGTIYHTGGSGSFQDNEQLNGSSSGDNCATTDGTRSYPPCSLYDYTRTADVIGDVPARIQYITFSPGGATELGRIWAGIRSENKVPYPEYYCCVWEMELGTSEDADVATDTEGSNLASPHNGTGVDHITLDEDRGGGSATDWDDGDWHEAWSWTLDEMIIEGDCENAIGDLLLLMRAQTAPVAAAATTWEVQLRVGYAQMADIDFLELWKVEVISDTASAKWEIYEMGIVRLPLRNYRALGVTVSAKDKGLAKTQFQIWVRRTSAADGDLDIDCIMPIPLDEGYLIFKESIANAATSQTWFGQGPLPKDRQVGCHDSTNYVEKILLARTNDFTLPPGDGRMIICYARDPLSTLGDILVCSEDSKGKSYERWANLRGSE